jgi:hypothetical protein
MYLIQILLPLYDNKGNSFDSSKFERLRSELTKTFGGMTAFRRSPAEGVWKQRDGQVHLDEIVIFEVMTETLDKDWWASYRKALEESFQQQELIIRATEFVQL